MTNPPCLPPDGASRVEPRTSVQLIDGPIDIERLVAAVQDRRAGAVVFFLGTTRQFTGERETRTLDYEAYRAMALAKLRELADEAGRRWPLVASALVHRLGQVPLSEASVAVAVSTPHRAAAFEAAAWLIDTLKEVVPIWKHETWADGTRAWIHPGVSGADNQTESQR